MLRKALAQAVLDKHGDVVRPLQNDYKENMSNVTKLMDERIKIEMSMQLVHKALRAALYLEEALVLNVTSLGTALKMEVRGHPHYEISSLLDTLRKTAPEHVHAIALPCLRNEFWLRRAQYGVGHDDLPEVVRIRSACAKCDALATKALLEINLDIEVALQDQQKIVDDVPAGIPPSVVFHTPTFSELANSLHMID